MKEALFKSLMEDMFLRAEREARKEGKEQEIAFGNLSRGERAVLEEQTRKHIREGRVMVVSSEVQGAEKEMVDGLFAFLSENFVTGEKNVPREIFRKAAEEVIRLIFEYVPEIKTGGRGKTEDITAVSPWRSALVAAKTLRDKGIKNFWHLDIERDKITAKPYVKFEDIPPNIDRNNSENNAKKKTIIFDPMLATGGTMMEAIERIIRIGIKPGNIHIGAIDAAPEGVCRILHKYPEIKITVGRLSEKLNSHAYIVGLGLGDFGDQALGRSGGVSAEEFVADLEREGILRGKETAGALRRRMGLQSKE
jgi:uracil phosphoribosyltransferase